MIEKAFTRNSRRFDGNPSDTELVCLLGEIDHSGNINVIDTPEILLARPGLIPMKFVGPWMLFVAVIITLAPLIAPRFGGPVPDRFAFAMDVVIWIGVPPMMFGIFIGINRYFTKKGDYFRVDKLRRKITLCPMNRTFAADEILAITEVSRWYSRGRGWGSEWTRQIGILVLVAEGQIEQYPLVRETQWQPFQGRLAERLAHILNVPLRRVRLGWRASLALKDW